MGRADHRTADEVLSALGPPPVGNYDLTALIIDAYHRGLEDGRAERQNTEQPAQT